jgi:hypothetical protein
MAYYWMFQNLPETKWRLGKVRILTMFAIMGLVFLVLSPTILLPETWREMGQFAGSKRVSHDGYEFMGRLYTQGFSDWLLGIPVYFYLVFTWVKLPVLTVAGFLIGLPLLFRRKLGDGRYFILFWMFLWFISFGFSGGKFTRYYTTVLPAVLITSALGIQWAGRWLAQRFSGNWSNSVAQYLPAALAVLVITCSVISSAQAAPHYRLFTNMLGGGSNSAGYYFPHDEFYDASLRDTIVEIARRATPGAKVASESASVASYYAQRAKRPDLVALSLSDAEQRKQLGPGDFIIIARGRRYFSNDAIISALAKSKNPDFEMFLGSIHSADVYVVDDKVLEILGVRRSGAAF